MGFGDFQLNNNGKKEVLQNAKNGVRKEQVDKKFHNLFDAYDANKDGTLETNELNEIFNGLSSFAGDDKVLDTAENQLVRSVFAEKMNLQNADFMGFVKSVSTASADIISSKEIPTADGGKEVVTTYKDGTTETISYYPDGEYKFKKVDAKTVSTSYYYTVGNNLNKKYTAQQVEDVIKDAYKHENHVTTTRSGEKTTEIARFSYKDFKKVYISRNNIKKLMATSESERHDLELSERAKQDVAVRDFVLSHYIETHKAAKEALESMGILDNAGALINAGAGETWNAIKNKWNGTEEEYQNFYELKDKFAPNNKKLETLQQTQGFVQRNQDEYFKSYETSFQENFGQKYDLEISTKFQAKAEQYQNAQILKERLNLLKTAMDEVEQYDIEKNSNLLMPGDVNTASSHITKANELLLQYFGGDQNAVDMILNGALGDENAKVVQAIKDIYTETQKMNEAVLGGKSFDEIQDEYKTQYKEMYNTDFVPDDLTEKVMDAKATGSMVKLAAITIISILITRSPIMAEINGAIAGGAEATGAAANLVKTLVTKYGQNAVAQGIKFAMTSGTLTTDVGLTLLNQVTSERGVNGEELWESTKSSAKFIYFGAYVGGPLAQAVSKQFCKIGVATKMFDGGVKASNGAVQTTTIAGDKLMQNLMKGGNVVLTKGSAFLTDVAAFTALEVATDGQDVATAGKEQLEFLPKLKIMNGIIEYMLGGKVHTGMIKAKMDAAIEKSGVKNWEIKEIKSPTKSMYEVKIAKDMPPIRFENANDLATAISEVVAGKYERLNDAKADVTKADKRPNYLREVDKYTRDAKINQANYQPGKSGLVAKKALSQPKVQQNVTRYLDNLLESNPEILKNSKSSGEIKPDVDYILPDGTVVSLKMNSAGEMFWNEKTQKYDVNFNSNPEIILWVKDTKGEEHIIPSFSEGNKARAQKILDYMSTLTAVPRDKIAEAQKAAIATRQDLNNQKNAMFEHPTVSFSNTPALDECQMNRQSYAGMLKLARNSDVQNEVSKCFDTLLEQVPKEFKYSETDSRPKREIDVMLPDGTVLSRGSLPNFAKNGEILIYCRNSDGSKEYFLIATTPQDIAKAQRIYDYMSQLPIVKRAIISDVQDDIKDGIPFKQAIKNRTEILNKKTEIEKENAHKKHINELLSLGSNSPTEIKFVTMDSPEIANITLTMKEKINAKVKNQKLEEVLNKKKIDTMYSRNAAFGEVADNISAHLTNLFYRLSTELNLDPMKEYAYDKEMPYDTPIELPDGTKIIKEKVVKDDNFKHEPHDIISYITPDGKKYSLQCFSMLNVGYARNIENMMLQAIETQNKTKLPYIKPETKVDLTPEAKAQVKDAVQNIRNNYRASFDQIKADLKAMGLDDIGNMSIRLKGEQSLYDKIANYMLEHKGATLEDAIKDVRDAIGARTVVESGKFANHPEVKALLDAGKEREAMLRAAELQSEPAVESLKSEILKQEQNNNHLVTARISNYVSPDGIPYLSENQLADLKQFAANHGVKLKINLRIDPSDPNFSKIDENYKPTTKSQPSGYTALQVNFTTKDGKIIEWQFRGDKVNEFAEGEHIPYDLRTGKNIIGEHKELEELYNPFIDMLSEKNMNKETYKEYNRYLGDYYTHLRKLELGFDSVEPKLEDYGKGFKFDERLSAKNLIVLHETAEKIKNKVLSVKDAMDEYNKKIAQNK